MTVDVQPPQLPSGAATEATLDAVENLLDTIGGLMATGAKQDAQTALLGTIDTDTGNIATNTSSGNTLTGAVNESAPGTDTASSGLNGRLQRIAQNITTLIAKFTVGAGTEAAALRVTLPTDGTGKVGLNAGTNNIGDVDVLTVPADPFGANADAAVAAGATGSIQAKLRRATQGLEDLKTGVVLAASTNTQEVVGDVAEGVALAGNPVRMGIRGESTVPSAVDDGDVVTPWGNLQGAQIVAALPHIGLNGDPYSLVHETAQYTTTQTGTALVTPTGGKKLVVTKVQIQAGGTAAGTMQLWFGASGDTTYSRGTDRAIFDGEFAPSTSNKPGVVMDGPWIAGAADDILRVTDSAAINPLTVTVWYYEI